MADIGTPTIFIPPERARTYHFPKGETVRLENITELVVRPSGTHRLKTANGKAYIVPTGWLYIELDIEDWTS